MSDRFGRVGELLVEKGLRLVTAESCTGGLVAKRLTDRPGASRFFDAGLVVYSDEAKQTVLGVSPETVAAHGAVSEAVAREMVRGARERADAAVAITGIAGPSGGTAEKPVGTVWIAASVGDRERIRRYRFDGDRQAIRDAAADAALELVEDVLEEAG